MASEDLNARAIPAGNNPRFLLLETARRAEYRLTRWASFCPHDQDAGDKSNDHNPVREDAAIAMIFRPRVIGKPPP